MNMFDSMKGHHVMSICVMFGLLTCHTTGNVISQTAIVSSHFMYSLRKEMFFETNSTDIYNMGNPVYFVPSTAHHPDLPEWLHFVQRNKNSGGFLYGSPTAKEDATQLQVVAVNEATMEAKHKILNIRVAPKGVPAEYFIELYITNFDIDEMLSGNVNEVLNIVKDMWPRGGDVYVMRVESLAEMEGRKPVPTSPGTVVVKEGVYMKIGGTKPFSRDLLGADVELQGVSCELGNEQETRLDIANHFLPEYVIDWCKFKLIHEPRSSMTTAAPLGPIELDDGGVEWSGAGVERRDLQQEFMYTVVLALVLAVVLAIILAYAMFGRREGVEKRDQMTPETQMMQFNSIRRATTNLRLMSDRRQTPQPQVSRERYSSATLSPKRSSRDVYADRPATLPRQSIRRPGAGIEYDITRDDECLVEETPNTVLSRDNPVMF